MRPIPLNDIALRVCKELLERAEKKGSVLPDHYVFPYTTKKHNHDPTRHQMEFKTAWDKMLKFAGVQRYRLYDMRHTSITRLCENPENSEETIEAIAGHVTHQMKKRYCHIRVEARRAALAGLVPERLDKNYPLPGNNPERGPVRTGKPLDNQNVLDLVGAGLSAKVIVAKIERAPGNFDTAPDTLTALKAAGVPDSVILAMVQA